MWQYEQLTGKLYDDRDALIAIGYSGGGEGKNNPALQNVHNVGPIPIGVYRIGRGIDTVTHGPLVLPLTPMNPNIMNGRYGFLIHGDSLVQPGTASEGCIIMPRDVRSLINDGGDKFIRVVSGIPAANGDICNT